MSIPRIHQDTIDEIKEKADIIDVISDYVVIKKKGKDYQGLCPFHEEKTPSFTVSPIKQLYYCFGCGNGGNIFKFLMELNKTSFAETIIELAQRYQIPVKTLETTQKQELEKQLSLKEHLYEILAVTTNFFQHALFQDTGKKALEYLQKKRGFNDTIIQKFKLGYAPSGWETLYHYLVEMKRYPLEFVEQAGLIKPRKTGSGYYDNFRDRIIIPICDVQGKVIAFGGRSLGDEMPKYLNSPETILFNKSKNLFCLDKAKNSISKEDKAIVVEGYFDAISLHSVGIENVVATLGTALQKQQIIYLSRYTESKQILFNFDTDNAGNEATKRAINEIENLVYSGQINLKIIEIPQGKDADEFLKSDPNNITKYYNLIENSPFWIDWQIDKLLENKDLKNSLHLKQISQNMLKIIQKIEDKNQKTLYVGKCAELLSQGDTVLTTQYMNNFFTDLKNVSKGYQRQEKKPIQEETALKKAEELLLIMFLHFPQYRQEIINKLEEKQLDFNFSIHRELWQKILQLGIINEENQKNQLLENIQNQLMETPEKLNLINHLFFLKEENQEKTSRPPLQIESALITIELEMCQKYANECLKKWLASEKINDTQKWQFYGREYPKIMLRIQDLKKQKNYSNEDIINHE